jgi:hypothetical protein
MNAALIFYYHSQIFELCVISEGFISDIYTVILSCFLIKRHRRVLRFLSSRTASLIASSMFFIVVFIFSLVTVAERSRACIVFARSEAGTVGSNPTQGMDV